MEEIFTAEFVIHEVACGLPYIAKPAITIRFLEFPTLTIFGTRERSLVFNKGKSCKFSMTLTTLRESLKRFPLYIMLIDALPNSIKMLGTAAVDLSGFAETGLSTSTEFKRNTLNLHDPIKNVVAKVDLSISIAQYTDGFARTPSEVFEKIKYDNIRPTSVENKADKAVGTEGVPIKALGKVMVSAETMTGGENLSQEVQTSVFQENYTPPPMFFTKTKAQTKPNYYPTVQPVFNLPVIEPPATGMLIDQLIKEIQQLKQVSALQHNWSYPPVMNFEQPKVEKSERMSTSSQNKTVKESRSEYSEDFEEESVVKSSSREGLTKCYVCNEMIRASEARDHPKNCKKIRERVSPRNESGDTWGREAMKSATSIVEEYESDFEAESARSSNKY